MISNDIFVRAFENLRAGVLLLERATGRVMEANPAFLRMCGRPRSGVVGRSFWAPPLIDDAEAGAEVFEHLRAGGRVEGAELPLETGDGGRLLLEVSGGELADGVVQLEVQDAPARASARKRAHGPADGRATLAGYADGRRVYRNGPDIAGRQRDAGELRPARPIDVPGVGRDPEGGRSRRCGRPGVTSL